MEESVIFTFPYEASGNHDTEPSTISHIISQWHWESNLDFTKTINNHELK